VHVALYRSQLWQKTFLILDDIVKSVDERIAARMELVALDLREAILKRHAAIAHSPTEEEALGKELTLIRASRAAHL
jgi:ABC-type nitrate/sulfonate/bicarbonate transport system ATPase subunit